MMNTGTAEFETWIAAGRCHWKQQDKKYSSNFAPATDAVINLRCILLALKLISIASSGKGQTCTQDPTLIIFALRQLVQKALNHIK